MLQRNDTDSFENSFEVLTGKTMTSRSQRARGSQGRRADRESESGEHEEVPSDSAEPGKKAALPSTRRASDSLPAGLRSDMTCPSTLAPFMTTGRRPVSQARR